MALVQFVGHDNTWETEVSLGTTMLEAARACGAPEGDACGGVCACSTCHLYVTQGGDLLSEAEEAEEDRLDLAFDVQITSRLGCQSIIEREGKIVATVSDESLDAYYNEHDDPDPRDG